MREIKFRAWNENIKKMTDNFLIIPSRGVAIQWFDDGHTGATLEHFPLMQYTGLKDKNGKEIYEGDIVKCYTKSLQEVVYNHEVKLPHFYQEIWCSFITEDGMWLPCDIEIKGGDICYGVEIIGNIYENSELIS